MTPEDIKTICPYYQYVPKNPRENLEWRKKVIAYGSASQDRAHELWMMCARDILFYANTFCFLVEPRITAGVHRYPVLPFITYEYQDAVLCDIKTRLGYEDILIEKSRDMGASWMCLVAIEHAWHFRDMLSFMLVSRKADLVDARGDPDALFWKIDHLHAHMPAWMLPSGRAAKRDDPNRTEMHLLNRDNGSVIDGQPTTGDVGVGGRRTGILLDEFAKVRDGEMVARVTRDNTNCRIFNSTPEGKANAFFRQKEKIQSVKGCVVTLHWTLHPEKSKGIYRDVNGKPRSTWYDAQCNRAATHMEIAQELDIDYLGSSYQYFDAAMMDSLSKEFCRPAYVQGELIYHPESGTPERFVQRDHGRLKLWCHVTEDTGQIVERRYTVIGGDVAQAAQADNTQGKSNSVLSVGDPATGEKLAELVTHTLDASELASYAVALAKWFSEDHTESRAGSYLIWEGNGPGMNFGKKVVSLGYRNIYYNQSERDIAPKPGTQPGYFTNLQTKNALIERYQIALKEKKFINRSQPAMEEALEYVWSPDGKIMHQSAHGSSNPAEGESQHGDRVIADAILWHGMTLASAGERQVEVKVIEYGSIGARRLERQRMKREQNLW